MNMHTTNYFNTFIEVAGDCPATRGTIPPGAAGSETIASCQFRMIRENPYRFTSDEVIFRTWADRQNPEVEDKEEARVRFFSKGQPCLRSSPLVKRYGWGIHSDQEGKVALFGVETDDYLKILNDSKIIKIKGMRTTRK